MTPAHDYQAWQLPITVAIIETHLDDLLAFSRAILAAKLGQVLADMKKEGLIEKCRVQAGLPKR